MPGPAPATSQPAPILLVDDNPKNLLVLEAVLAGPEMDLVRAGSGTDALRRLAERDFAVVLLDLHMPGLDGFETARRARAAERSRFTPIIFVTAHDDTAFPIREAYALGAVDYLTKPFVPEVLRAKVAVFVELFRKAEHIRELERSRGEAALKATDARLQDREALLRTLGDHLREGAVYQLVANADGSRRFTYISAGIQRMLGVAPADVMADARTLYSLIVPEDGPRVAAAEEAAVTARALFDCEFRSHTSTGDVKWVHCLSAPREQPDGTPVWDGLVIDITTRRRAEEALRRSEERFRLALASGAVTAFEQDAELRYTWVYPDTSMLGGRSIGRTDAELHAADEAEVLTRLKQQVMATRQGVRQVVPLALATGVEYHDLIVEPLIGPEGRVIGVNGAALDVTDREQAVESLREADRRKDEFLATLAHELRNPLAPIRTAVEIMRLGGGLPPAAAKARDVIERQVEHMVRLVNDLLDVSRITRGKIVLNREKIDLLAVIRGAVEASMPAIETARHTLTVETDDQPIWITGDSFRLTQVVSNLLNNAAKYTEPAGTIHLRARREAGMAVVRVRDTGVGLRAEDIPQVFDLFAQVGVGPSRQAQGGLGIGLGLVKRLVSLHGGTVEAHSDGLAQGSEFVVRLPMNPEPEA